MLCSQPLLPEISFSCRIKLANDYCFHVINFEKTPHLISAEISALFWESDLLRSMVCGYCSDINSSTKDTMQLGCFFLKELACPNSILLSVQALTYNWGSFKADLSRSSNSGHEYI